MPVLTQVACRIHFCSFRYLPQTFQTDS